MLQSSGPIGSLDPDKKIHIIGGGFSGLIAGYFLKKNGFDFTLYEKAPSVGGKLSTLQTEFGPVEQAANAIYADDNVYKLLYELNLSYITPQNKLKKKIWRNKKFTSPISFWETLSMLPKLRQKPHVNDSSTVKEVFAPLLGDKVVGEVLAAALAGVYGVDVGELHFKSLFKDQDLRSYWHLLNGLRKKRRLQKYKMQSLSFTKGMQELTLALEKNISTHINYSVNVQDLPKDNLLICTNASEAADILADRLPPMALALKKITYAPLTSITLFSSKNISSLKGCFGALFPPKTPDLSTIGILANSEIFKNRVTDKSRHSYTFIMQGSKTLEDLERDIKKLGPTDFISLENSPAFIKDWPMALPIYNQERYEAILKLRSLFLQQKTSLAIMGNYVDGISLREMIKTGQQLVNELNKLKS